MKLADHVNHLRELIEASFDKQFARIGFGKAKQLSDEQVANLPEEVKEKRTRFVQMLESHIGETGSYDSAREKLLDELTFTLFNRLAAIKVMEAANLFPPILTKQIEHGDRSFGHKVWLEMNPHMRDEELEGLHSYLESAFDDLAQTLPLYSKAYPYGMLPDTVSLNDIIDAFNAVEQDDQINSAYEDGIWHSDDVLGWMYESYNNKKKQTHKESKAKTEFNKVSLQSQVYTPRWVVQFLVENSLGKMYLEMYPHSEIKQRYKIANAPTSQERKPKPLHEVRTIDPACGSGNFLLYAFDFYYELYLDQIENYGADYEEKDIPKLIIENNLHGIDLDDRAVQLAQLGLFIKAKKKRRTIGELNFRVVSSDFYLPEYAEVKHIFEQGNLVSAKQQEFIEKVWADLMQAYKFGSLIHIDKELKEQLAQVKELALGEAFDSTQKLKKKIVEGDLFAAADYAEHKAFAKNFFENLFAAVEQYAKTDSNTFLSDKTRDALVFLELLTTEYDVATANPPYTDSSDFGPELKAFINGNYQKPYKFNTNLYATFIKRCYELTGKSGFVAMLHPLTFMYIKTFEDVRKFMLTKTNVNLLVELGLGGVFANSAVQVDAAMYVLEKIESEVDGVYFDLKKYKNHTNKSEVFNKIYENYVLDTPDKHVFTIPQNKLKIIKSWPFIYWISDDFREKFKEKSFDQYFSIAVGLMTGNNNKFLRFFWEVNPGDISKEYISDKKKWVPYQKGGDFNRWYGNNWLLVDYQNDGKALASRSNSKYYFSNGITYSATSSKGVSFRKLPTNQIFDIKGSCIFKKEPEASLLFALAILNSKLSTYIVKCLNSTVETQTGDVKRIPYITPDRDSLTKFEVLVKSNIEIKKELSSFSLIDSLNYTSPIGSSQVDWFDGIKGFLDFENCLVAQVLINEAIINEMVFDIYSLTENDKSLVLSQEGLCVGGMAVSKDAKKAYLDEIENDIKYPLDIIRNYIESLPTIDYSDEERNEVESNFSVLYQGKNDIEYFSLRYNVNPIDIWYWFKQKKIIPQERKHILSLEFLADLTRQILMDDDDGIIPLVQNAGEKVLLDRIEQKFQEKGYSTAQYSSFETVIGCSFDKYLKYHFLKDLTNHLNIFKMMSSAPFIWHLTSGPEQGFDCYIIIYKWSRDNLLRLRSVYIENRERALINRQSDIADKETADAQNEKDRIFKQLKEIEVFKKKIDELLAEGYNPVLDDGVGKNIAPLQQKKMLAYDVLNAGQLKKYLNADW
ncbi:BREX-1 system adenine-specific DNA-methyltransferase PglX [Vibrio parahaemolyticus]|nr:BREX-1 system adenine-specific DNA-methyltransferase PglX [Vibrio parahaemolyticus]